MKRWLMWTACSAVALVATAIAFVSLWAAADLGYDAYSDIGAPNDPSAPRKKGTLRLDTEPDPIGNAVCEVRAELNNRFFTDVRNRPCIVNVRA